MKRWIAVVLLIGLCVGVFAGCDSTEPGKATDPAKRDKKIIDWNPMEGENLTEVTEPEQEQEAVFSPIWPCENARFVTVLYYYTNLNAKNGYRHSTRTDNHNAMDISGSVGDTIYAVEDGEIVFADYDETGFGNCVIIRHDNGEFSMYGHLDSIDQSNVYKTVNEDGRECYRIEQGQKIGTMGKTGTGTGPHLHFEMFLGSVEVKGNTMLVKPDRSAVVNPWVKYYQNMEGIHICSECYGDNARHRQNDPYSEELCKWFAETCDLINCSHCSCKKCYVCRETEETYRISAEFTPAKGSLTITASEPMTESEREPEKTEPPVIETQPKPEATESKETEPKTTEPPETEPKPTETVPPQTEPPETENNPTMDISYLVGNWKVDTEYTMEYNGVGMTWMFGSPYSDGMSLGSDGSISWYIVYCGGKGTYQASANGLNYTIITTNGGNSQSGTMSVKYIDGTMYLVHEYWSFTVFWKRA